MGYIVLRYVKIISNIVQGGQGEGVKGAKIFTKRADLKNGTLTPLPEHRPAVERAAEGKGTKKEGKC